MVHLREKKIVFLVLSLGVQAPVQSMPLLINFLKTGVKRSASSVGPFHNKAHSLGQSQPSFRRLCSCCHSFVSEESGLFKKSELEKLRNENRYAELVLQAALDQRAGALQWGRIWAKAVIDLEYKHEGDDTDAARNAIATAHRQAREAGKRMRSIQKNVAQAEVALAAVRKQFKNL